MNKFIITEEERNRILNLHEERTSKHYLMEQGPYAPGMGPTKTGPQGKSPGLNAPKIEEFKGVKDPEWRAICSDLQKLGFKQTKLGTGGPGTDDNENYENWEKNGVIVSYKDGDWRKDYVTLQGDIKWDDMPKDYKTNRCYVGVPSKSERLSYYDYTEEGDKSHWGYTRGGILKSCKKEVLNFASKLFNKG